MIKHLIAFVLVASLGSAACANTATNSSIPVMLDEETLQVIKQEVTIRLEQEAQTNKKVALAMQTEAAKRQLLAYFITGVLVAGGLAMACWYFWPKKAVQSDETSSREAKSAQTDPKLATGAAASGVPANTTAEKVTNPAAVVADKHMPTVEMLQAMRTEMFSNMATLYRQNADYCAKKAGNTICLDAADIETIKKDLQKTIVNDLLKLYELKPKSQDPSTQASPVAANVPVAGAVPVVQAFIVDGTSAAAEGDGAAK